ncbi:MAG: hypothetical protein KFF73_20395 [Cyclobacteriaceae bacterium]|nr:hypothetical protein [Cyclobacteriaceae bacterium]
MKYIKFPVFFTSAFLMIYALLPSLGAPFFIVFVFFILMLAFLFWMVYRILKDGEPSGRKFTEHWYDDVDIPRNNPR